MGKLYEFVSSKESITPTSRKRATRRRAARRVAAARRAADLALQEQLIEATYEFSEEDIGKDNQDNFLHIALKSSQKYKDIIEAFIRGFDKASSNKDDSTENPYRKVLTHLGGANLAPIQSVIEHAIPISAYLLRCFFQNKGIFEIISDPNTSGSKTILHYLIQDKSPSLIREYIGILIINFDEVKAKEVINHPDEDGNTPLHLAAQRGIYLIARTLLRFGAASNEENKAGQTALDVAKASDYITTAKLIEHYSGNAQVLVPGLLKRRIFIHSPVIKDYSLEDIRNMVFCGGGVKGVAYLGVIQALEQKYPPLLENLQNVAGTSAGAITAFLLALGYGSDDIEKFLFGDGATLTQFIERNNKTSRKLESYSAGIYFMRWLKVILAKRLIQIYCQAIASNNKGFIEEITEIFSNIFSDIFIVDVDKAGIITATMDKLGKRDIEKHVSHVSKVKNGKKYLDCLKNINFVDFHALVEACRHYRTQTSDESKVDIPNLRDFACVATCLSISNHQNITFSWDSRAFQKEAQRIAMVDAVRASMAFAGVFSTHIIKIGGVKYEFSDGGILDNYPISIFDDPGVAGQNNKTLGFLLVNPQQILEVEESLVTYKRPLTRNILSTLLKIKDAKKGKLNLSDLARTVVISNVNVGTLEFNMKKYKEISLISSGKLATLEFLESVASRSQLSLEQRAESSSSQASDETSNSEADMQLSNIEAIKELLLEIQIADGLASAQQLAKGIQRLLGDHLYGSKEIQKCTYSQSGSSFFRPRSAMSSSTAVKVEAKADDAEGKGKEKEGNSPPAPGAQ